MRYLKDCILFDSINIYNRLHPQTHIYPGISGIWLRSGEGAEEVF